MWRGLSEETPPWEQDDPPSTPERNLEVPFWPDEDEIEDEENDG